MTIHFEDAHLTVHVGDCREVMAELPAESVHCVVTSPPYWGLRDYGTATWAGGDEGHEHVGSVMRTAPPGTEKQASNKGASSVTSGDCACGAIRVDSQLGLEATPEAYVEAMVGVFREVKRVLRSDGTVWLNLGDSYAHGAGGDVTKVGGFQCDTFRRNPAAAKSQGTASTIVSGLKPKDLVGIPWRVAFALQADGWWLRSDIIWSKPNPMPESVTDRPIKSHEMIFLLTKSPRYFFDADAVREGVAEPGVVQGSNGHNLRSVWTIATQPYPGAHFATFPEALVKPCVKAGTSERGVCPECGAPWVRETKVSYVKSPVHGAGSIVGSRNAEPDTTSLSGGYANKVGVQGQPRLNKSVETTGWRRPCEHEAEPVPATVLDPFAGTGTTGLVAQHLGRRAVLIDLSADYLVQCLERNRQVPMGLGA